MALGDPADLRPTGLEPARSNRRGCLYANTHRCFRPALTERGDKLLFELRLKLLCDRH